MPDLKLNKKIQLPGLEINDVNLLTAVLASKQDILTPGNNITIEYDETTENTIISAMGQQGVEEVPSTDPDIVYGRKYGQWVEVEHTDIIDDSTISLDTTYSSNKIETLLSNGVPTLEQVLTKGKTTTKEILINTDGYSDSTQLYSNGIIARSKTGNNVADLSSSVINITTNNVEYESSLFATGLQVKYPSANRITHVGYNGITTDGKQYLNALDTQVISNADAQVMRAKLQILNDTQYTTVQTYSSDKINRLYEETSARIDAVEGLGGYLTPYDFEVAEPTQQAFTDYALQQIKITDPLKIFNGTRIENLFDGMVWILANTPDTDPPVFEWVKGSSNSVSVATNSSLGIVKGSIDNLKVGVAFDGTMQTNGLTTALDSKLSIANLLEGSNITFDREGDTITINSSGGGGGNVDLSNYFTKTQSNARFALKEFEHSHANKALLDLFSLEGGVLKYNGNAIPINPTQLDFNEAGTYSATTIFNYTTLCSTNNIKAIMTSYLFMQNTAFPTPDLEEDQEDPNNATIEVYNAGYKLDTIIIRPRETQTFHIPSSLGISVKATGEVNCQATIVGYVY